MSYLSLFVAAFLAATLLPAQSELLLVYLLNQGDTMWLLLLVASVGNILGSCVNFGLGRSIHRFRHYRWFAFDDKELAKAQYYYQRYGVYSLLLSWMPIIGDPLTLVAGVLGERFWRFLVLVGVAKVGRYVVICATYQMM